MYACSLKKFPRNLYLRNDSRNHNFTDLVDRNTIHVDIISHFLLKANMQHKGLKLRKVAYILVCVLSILSASVVERSLEKKSDGNRTAALLIVSNIECLTPKKFSFRVFLTLVPTPRLCRQRTFPPCLLQLAAEQIPENFCCCINTNRYIYLLSMYLDISRYVIYLYFIIHPVYF